ncbi:MAG TPA: fatty acid desaturase, partial [Polyangiales bacterium]|nr:fatty acid desaturase [Polyangiales bacterium]
RADLRTLGFLIAYAALVVLEWRLAPPMPLALLFVAATCALSWICAVIAHNTVHSPLFKQRGLNRAFQIWVSLSYGFPISDYVPGHNLSHHRYTQEREDVMRTSKARFRWNLLNLLFFAGAVSPAILRGNAHFKRTMGTRAKVWQRQLLLEGVIVWAVKIGLILLDWKKALLYVVVPHLFANWGIVTVNYLQHDGTDQTHPVNHSRNFVGKLFNWWTLNNGFHGMHHMVPGLHWSLLPQAHAEKVAPTIHPALEQPSLLLYCWKAFVYPGKRTRFDGVPVVLGEEGPDHEWVRPDDRIGLTVQV